MNLVPVAAKNHPYTFRQYILAKEQ